MDIIKTFNPENQLTQEQLEAMRNLTDEQIAELAKAYPNQPRGNAYLVYYITGEKPHEQRYPLGTWANLLNLRKLGRKDIIPYAFKKGFLVSKTQSPATAPAPQRTIDLSQEEAKNAEGLKTPGTAQAASPELLEAQEKLQQAIKDKAHPNTVRALQKKFDDLKNKTAE